MMPMTIFMALLAPIIVFGQTSHSQQPRSDVQANRDSLTAVERQELRTDTLEVKTKKEKKKAVEGSKPFLEGEVKYSATDSLAFDFSTKKMYLFGKATVNYGEISLTAHRIELDMDSTTAYACGYKDSLGVYQDNPVFKDKSGEYEMREMKYNFKTKKAFITHVVTEQGEGYIVGNKAKRVDEETYFMRDAKYTTCSNHDHPHYYLNLTKAKVVPGKKTVTGPAYLVLEDVPMPLAIPFAIIPNTKSYSSGIVMPTYGDESTRGFYLRNGGYYMAANDYFDMKLLADIYTKGSWGAHVSSTYKKRYKFTGSFSSDYIVNKTSEKGLPDYATTKDFSLRWNHSQDAKANPDITFSANVNYSTTSYDKHNVSSLVNPKVLSNNQKSSSIVYTRKWANNPFRISVSLLHSQNSRDTTINLTMPDFRISSSKRFYPFKPKKLVGQPNPFQDINFSYGFEGKNDILCKESELSFTPQSLSTAWKNGFKHSISATTNIKLWKYFTMGPSISYTERWYVNKTKQHWDEEKQAVVKEDPVSGFNRAYDYNFSTGLQTKVYVFFRPIRALFGDFVNAFRWTLTPNVSFGYTPDFSKPRYGTYDYFEYYDKKNDKVVKHKYSYFDSYKYGAPSSSESGRISLSLNNNLEMKIKSEEDSTGYKKISIIEGFQLSSSYDLMKDSLKWDVISTNLRTKIFGSSISINASFDQYGYVASPKGACIRVDRAALKQNHRLAHLISAGTSFGFQLSPETFNKMFGGDSSTGNQEEENEDWSLDAAKGDDELGGADMPRNSQGDNAGLTKGEDGYAEFTMPWSLSFNFSLRMVRDKFNPETCLYKHKITSSVNVSGNISLTPKWKITASSGYSFDEKTLSQTSFGITRDLHCWTMNLNVVPIGLYKSYNFNIAISSSILKDLKYTQSNSPRDNGRYR